MSGREGQGLSFVLFSAGIQCVVQMQCVAG